MHAKQGIQIIGSFNFITGVESGKVECNTWTDASILIYTQPSFLFYR
jgi:hypothetical protein